MESLINVHSTLSVCCAYKDKTGTGVSTCSLSQKN